MAIRKRKDEGDLHPESSSGLFEVLESFATDLESGVPVVAVKGELFEQDHELVRRHPELFCEAGLPSWHKTKLLQQRDGR